MLKEEKICAASRGPVTVSKEPKPGGIVGRVIVFGTVVNGKERGS